MARVSPDPAVSEPQADPLAGFHPLVARWFTGRFAAPTAPQAGGGPRIASGQGVVIAAPPRAGKTLPPVPWALHPLRPAATRGPLADRTAVVYAAPRKAP